MWIEAYKSKGQRYYRIMEKDMKPVHIGSADQVFRKLRPDLYAERKKPRNQPTEKGEGEETNSPRNLDNGGLA